MIDVLKTFEEINSLFFNTLYLWTVAYVSPLVISYHDIYIYIFIYIYFCPY
jgi:hypothetical protein